MCRNERSESSSCRFRFRSQAFTYDTLNRMTQAQAGSLSGVAATFDPWGSLYQASGAAGAELQAMSVAQTINGANQFTLQGYGYDAAGNVLSDGLSYGCGAYG